MIQEVMEPKINTNHHTIHHRNTNENRKRLLPSDRNRKNFHRSYLLSDCGSLMRWMRTQLQDSLYVWSSKQQSKVVQRVVQQDARLMRGPSKNCTNKYAKGSSFTSCWAGDLFWCDRLDFKCRNRNLHFITTLIG